MHRRAAIRQAVVAVLQGLPTTAARVHVSRVYPDHLVEAGPSLSVYLDGETIDRAGAQRGPGGELLQDRYGELVVEGRFLETTAALDDLLDASALEVEAAIMADPELGGLATWIELEDVAITREADREQPLVVQRMTFRAEYHPDARDPQ